MFNKWLDDDGYDVWEPTSIRGVSWYSNVETVVSEKGLLAANKYILRIPENAQVLYSKAFVEPKAYQDSDKSASWTLQQGDVIVKGTVTSPKTLKELKEEHDDLVTILGVTDNRRAPNAPHWKAVGK